MVYIGTSIRNAVEYSWLYAGFAVCVAVLTDSTRATWPCPDRSFWGSVSLSLGEMELGCRKNTECFWCGCNVFSQLFILFVPVTSTREHVSYSMPVSVASTLAVVRRCRKRPTGFIQAPLAPAPQHLRAVLLF